jgi:hypothetical protein
MAVASEEDLRKIGDREDWSRQQSQDYAKLSWGSRRVIDLILRFPRFINWVRSLNTQESDTRIGRAMKRAREAAKKAKTK